MKFKITIEGMHCSSCASNVERVLENLKGINEVSVSVLTKKAFIECEANVSKEDLKKVIEKIGLTTAMLAENKKVIGIFGVADAVKEDSREAIALLSAQGYKVIMISGDNERTAREIAREVGISQVIAQVLPQDKQKKIEELQKQGFVCFVGDGINDAPALKQANVSIALGTGTDIAIETGDIVISNGSLMGVVHAVNLYNATFRKIKQNLFWAFAYNTIAIPLAIAGILNPVVAEIAMALSSISVVGNANLLRQAKI